MVHGFPERSNVGLDSCNDCDSRCETLSDRYQRCSLQNLIQHIDIYGKFKTNYVSRYIKDGSCKSMITATCYRNLKNPRQSTEQLLEEKMSKLSVTTKTSSLYPGHDKMRRLKKFQKVLVR